MNLLFLSNERKFSFIDYKVLKKTNLKVENFNILQSNSIDNSVRRKDISKNTCYIVNVLQYIKIYCNILRNIHIIQWSSTDYRAQICMFCSWIYFHITVSPINRIKVIRFIGYWSYSNFLSRNFSKYSNMEFKFLIHLGFSIVIYLLIRFEFTVY